MSHLSFEGQSKVSYCLECSEKHGATAKVFMREALQRVEACSCTDSDGVLEKVRGVIEELSGMEDDTQTTENQKVTALNSLARDIRKEIFALKAEVGGASIEDLRGIKEKIDALAEQVYEVRKTEDCPSCKVKVEAETKAEEPQEEKHDYSEYGKSVSEARQALIEEIRHARGE